MHFRAKVLSQEGHCNGAVVVFFFNVDAAVEAPVSSWTPSSSLTSEAASVDTASGTDGEPEVLSADLRLLGPASRPALGAAPAPSAPGLGSAAGPSSASHTEPFNIARIFRTAPLVQVSMRDANWSCGVPGRRSSAASLCSLSTRGPAAGGAARGRAAAGGMAAEHCARSLRSAATVTSTSAAMRADIRLSRVSRLNMFGTDLMLWFNHGKWFRSGCCCSGSSFFFFVVFLFFFVFFFFFFA
ncbi:hypothetical protein EYF80_056328 [Liparis tanakae]|uniref:Uncharacterized protein n=1 Tax=Liparis tanakae TaxID=230148 RepID=A0A4Z2EX57_9TELE|nr:hypothetical protein EYF80_056328 [Liparis tanakae]